MTRIEQSQSQTCLFSCCSSKNINKTLVSYLGRNMVFSTQRLFILLICIGFFTVEPAKGSSLRSIYIVLRWSKEDDGPALNYQRTLNAVEMQTVNTEKEHAPVNKTLDPNQSSKRRVRRGSDPIHNRSWCVEDTSAINTKKRTSRKSAYTERNSSNIGES